MLLLLLLVPLFAMAILVLLGVGIACSPGFREVLLGMKGKSKLSLLNFISFEGVGASIIVVVIFSSGVLFPLYKAAELESAVENEVLRAELEDVKARLEAYMHPATWTIKGRFALPHDFEREFETYLSAEAFWWQGNWEAFLTNADMRIVPVVRRFSPIRSSLYREAEFELDIQVPGNVDLHSQVGEIRYEHKGEDLSATLMLEGEFETEWRERGAHGIEFFPVRLHQYLPLDHEIIASRADSTSAEAGRAAGTTPQLQ